MAAITTAQAGNWSATATWTGGVVPGDGDTVTINHNVTVDTNTTVGTSAAAGTIVIQVASGKDLTVASGVTLTVRGDTRLGNGTLTMSAGSTYLFDSSVASGTPQYKIRFSDASSQASTKLICNGTSGSRVTFNKVSGSANGVIGRYANGVTAWGSINATYTDFIDLGKTSQDYDNDAIEINANGSGSECILANCTFTRCGLVDVINCNAAANLSITNCLFDAGINTNKYDLRMTTTTATTGQRVLTGNVFYHISQTRICVFVTSVKGFVCERNVFGSTLYSATSSNDAMASCRDNLFFQRAYQNGHIGEPNATVLNNYMIGDVGAEQGYLGVFGYTTGSGGRVIYDGWVYENTGSNIDSDLSQALLPTVAITVRHIRGLAVPNSAGHMSGNHTAHGNANITLEYEHNTMVSRQPGTGTGDAAFYNGSGYAGFAGMIPYCRSNLVWAKARPTYDGWVAFDASGTVADVATPSGLNYNATYNLNDGTVYDSAGANGQTKRGYQGWRLSNQSIGANDVTLADGSNEQTEGPKFADPTRCFVGFDSAYLGNTPTAWADATAYSVGDIVSASDSGFYGGLTVNFRCVTAHTSSTGHATNGKPGVATSFRTNWEPASYYRIRQAILAGTTITDVNLGLVNASYIEAVHRWVREGWRPRAASLANAAHDGATIGALDYLPETPEKQAVGSVLYPPPGFNFAWSRNETEALYPSLWRDLSGAWVGGFGRGGLTLEDWSWNRLDLAPGSGITAADLIPGHFGEAIRFTGASNCFWSLADNAALTSTTFALALWLRADILSGVQTIARWRAAGALGSAPGWNLELQGAGLSGMTAVEDVSGNYASLSGGLGLGPGRWYHLVLTHNGTELSCWLNGAKAASVSSTGVTGSINAAASLELGAFGNTQRFAGQMQQVYLYGRALDPAEIRLLASGYSPMHVRRDDALIAMVGAAPPDDGRISDLLLLGCGG